MSNLGKATTVLFLTLLCFGTLAAFAILDGRVDLSTAKESTPPAPVVLVDPGIVMTHSNIRAILGPGEVAVHTSLSDNPYRAATLTDATGVKHFWVPASMPAGLASLNTEEGQEYVLRRLAVCGTCEYDTSSDVLDPNLLATMAGDPDVVRVSEPSNMLQLAFVNFAERALEIQAELAKSGFDSNVAIAASGDASVVGTAAAGAAGQCIMGLVVITVIVGGLIFFIKSGSKPKQM